MNKTVRLSVAILWIAATCGSAGENPPLGAVASPLYKTSYRVIDIHAHAPFPSEDGLRAQFEVLDRVGIAGFNVLLFDPTGWPYAGGWSEANLTAWLDLRKRFPDRLLVFGTVEFGRIAQQPNFFRDVVTELEREARQGMQGVKVWKNLGMSLRDADGKLLEYLETDHPGLIEPLGMYNDWMRLKGIKLPPAVLEKLYHANAERLIPSLKR